MKPFQTLIKLTIFPFSPRLSLPDEISPVFGFERQVADALSRMPSKNINPPPWDTSKTALKITSTQTEGLNQRKKRFEMASKSGTKIVQELKRLLTLNEQKIPPNLTEFNRVREELTVEGDLSFAVILLLFRNLF